jgi:hypothetical protein
VGGYTAIDVDTAHVEIFNPADQKFVLSVPLNLARHGHSATLLPDGRVLVIAGYAGTWLASGEIFDPGLGKWTDTQPVYPHGTIHTATLLNDGRVLVIAGGTRSGSPGPDDRVEIFDPRTNSWQRAAPHQSTQGGHTATLLADGRVLIAGGNADPSIYDPNLDTWQPAGKLVTNRSQPQAVLLRDGKVLLVGGTSPYRDLVLENVEIYNPISNTWQQAAPMAQPRYLHTTTLLPDGRVLVTGGGRLLDNSFDDPNAILDTIEIYDPARDSWNIYHPLQQARANHTANLLPNGQVLVTGGWATGYAILNSIEILSIPPR